MSSDGQGSGDVCLRPAPVEQGDLRRLRIGVISYCLAEFVALVLVWSTGVVHHPTLVGGLTVGCATMGMSLGPTIETWLAIMSGEPLLNENDEIDSDAPFQRGLWYGLPPMVAFFGIFRIPVGSIWVPLLTSALSLLLFARIMRRIRAVYCTYRAQCISDHRGDLD